MRGWLRAAIARASRSNRSVKSFFETFTATVRSSRVSRALNTSPMPPSPIEDRISYGTSLVPGVISSIAPRSSCQIESPQQLGEAGMSSHRIPDGPNVEGHDDGLKVVDRDFHPIDGPVNFTQVLV